MITNSTATEENYYAVKFANTPILFSYGINALEAITAAAEDYTSKHRSTLGAAIARPAVYKEWIYAPWQYKNDGSFITSEKE